MRLAAAFLLLLASSIGASAACDLNTISAALDAPLGSMKPAERDVESNIQSTEGGIWQIYREKDGRLNTIIRIDGGESGRNDTRLSVVNRGTYGIAKTRTDYLRHAFVEEGPFGIARRTTDYFYFCDGKPYVPAENGANVDRVQYPRDALEIRSYMIDDRDVADVTKGLKR